MNLFEYIVQIFDDSSAFMLAVLVFLATAVLTFSAMLANACAQRSQAARRRHRRVFG